MFPDYDPISAKRVVRHGPRIAPQQATGAATCRRAAALRARLLLSLQPLKLLWGESVRYPHMHSDAIEHGHSFSQDSDR